MLKHTPLFAAHQKLGARLVEFGGWEMPVQYSSITAGHGQYTLLCNAQGGVIDDLYVYRIGATEFLLVINAGRIEADLTWLEKLLADWPQRASVTLNDAS